MRGPTVCSSLLVLLSTFSVCYDAEAGVAECIPFGLAERTTVSAGSHTIKVQMARAAIPGKPVASPFTTTLLRARLLDWWGPT